MTHADVLERLQQAAGRRAPLKSVTNAVRLVNDQGDNCPGLVVEQYNKHFCIYIFDAAWTKRLDWVTEFLATHFDVAYMILKDRSGSSASTSDAFKVTVLAEGSGPQATVTEYGVRFAVDLNDTLNAGLFLDMRANRRRIADLTKNKRLLNTFAYTCSFGVHARIAGAAGVVNVDVSKKILERGKANYALNDLEARPGEFVCEDALKYGERLVKRGELFDIIVLDPPSFARHDGKTFQVKKDLAVLIDTALAVLNAGGTLFVATNCSALTFADLQKYVKIAASSRRKAIKSMKALGQDVDFKGSGTMSTSHLAAALVQF